jgi:hypothetical protein
MFGNKAAMNDTSAPIPRTAGAEQLARLPAYPALTAAALAAITAARLVWLGLQSADLY